MNATNHRRRLPLDGVWDFAFSPVPTAAPPAETTWRQAQVPLPWQAQFDDLRLASGVGWYRRTVDLDQKPQGAAILHVGAADYQAAVWINGEFLGEHEGGYLPFAFDIADLLDAGANEILVRVVDPDNDDAAHPDASFNRVPHGKQSWYGPVGGIWQSVWLELRAACHVGAVRLTPSVADGAIQIDATVAGAPAHAAITLVATVVDPQGEQIAHSILADTQGVITLESPPRLWSPDDPVLYTVQIQLQMDGQVVDATTATCGFRTVEARDGRIYLNGEPIYLRGALDQAYYPETIYTPPSLEFLEEQARKAKALGLNCLRTHIKIEDPRYYDVADRLGLLIWTEIPNWVLLRDDSARRAKATFRAMVERDWNHPSIIAWTLINENWGTDLVRNPDHRRWLADFVDEAKQMDPTRLVVDNSACCDNFHVAGDLEDYHYYKAIPDHAHEWDAWVADYASRPRWAWAADHDHNRRADLPLIVSEFGNWGLPDPAAIRERGGEPWWFETGHDWGQGIVYPHGMENRFVAAGLDRLFGTPADFARQHQEHMARSLNYEISTMRLHPEIAGYVITEFTDVHWECNGLMDMQRNVKAGLDRFFVGLNQDNAVVARPQRWSGRPGATLTVDLQTMGVDGPRGDGAIHWRCGPAGGQAGTGAASIPLPAAPGVHGLELRWISDDGATVAENCIELATVDPPVPAFPVAVVGDDEFARTLAELGWSMVTDPDAAGVIIARTYDSTLERAVQRGAQLLLLLGTEHVMDGHKLPFGSLMARAGTPWQGDWATSLAWLKKSGPFAHLPGDPLLGMEYARIMPDAVLLGIPAHASWAGLALGWIHWTTSLVAKSGYGEGDVTLSTFKLPAELVAEDVVAQGLLAGLVMLAAD